MEKKIILAVVIAVLLYTRLIGLNWGLPYPLHPDERNMADAVTRLECKNITDLPNCFNPHFYAYGQVPLYLALAGISLVHLATGINSPITFVEATMALRFISVLASLLTAFVLFFLSRLLAESAFDQQPSVRRYGPWLAVLAYAFSPYGIQFAHFGTTESLLMLLYAAVAYLTLVFANKPHDRRTVIFLAVLLGLSIAVKVSSMIFLGIPFFVFVFLFFRHKHDRLLLLSSGITLLGLTAVTAAVLSPQTVISWNEFIGSFTYESSVATGAYPAFYTRQFAGTVPVLFQLRSIFPYTLGLIPFILSLLGLLFLSWKDKRLNILRLGILLYSLPTAFLFAKWARFMSPVFPLMTIFGSLFILQLFTRLRLLRGMALLLFAVSLLPGIAYLAVYTNPDVRFQASEWIYSHIPSGSKILSETANVIDIPVPPPGYDKAVPSYRYASFDYYHLDEDPNLQAQLQQYVEEADYIFVPSRRVFMNHPAAQYPKLREYYDVLFSGRLGYEKVKEFTAYPRISLFGRTLAEFPDEAAEETWTVFDHPVIRIYQKGNPPVSYPDFSGYRNTVFTIEGKAYRLLVADNQQKWEQGLMWVRSKEDAGGYDGMIFLFPEKSIQSFWNKNTVTDLDLYWIDGQKVVGKSELPSIEKSKQIVTATSPKEADKVIEIIH